METIRTDDTGWGFATGAPGAFFVLAHLAAGVRGVMMAHGVSKAFADRFMISGTVVAAIIATWIMLGMSGMRVYFV